MVEGKPGLGRLLGLPDVKKQCLSEISCDRLGFECTELGPGVPSGLSLELLVKLHWRRGIGSTGTKWASPQLPQGYSIALGHPGTSSTTYLVPSTRTGIQVKWIT